MKYLKCQCYNVTFYQNDTLMFFMNTEIGILLIKLYAIF